MSEQDLATIKQLKLSLKSKPDDPEIRRALVKLYHKANMNIRELLEIDEPRIIRLVDKLRRDLYEADTLGHSAAEETAEVLLRTDNALDEIDFIREKVDFDGVGVESAALPYRTIEEIEENYGLVKVWDPIVGRAGNLVCLFTFTLYREADSHILTVRRVLRTFKENKATGIKSATERLTDYVYWVRPFVPITPLHKTFVPVEKTPYTYARVTIVFDPNSICGVTRKQDETEKEYTDRRIEAIQWTLEQAGLKPPKQMFGANNKLYLWTIVSPLGKVRQIKSGTVYADPRPTGPARVTAQAIVDAVNNVFGPSGMFGKTVAVAYEHAWDTPQEDEDSGSFDERVTWVYPTDCFTIANAIHFDVPGDEQET